MSSHRALSTQDILEEVFSHLSIEPTYRDCQRHWSHRSREYCTNRATLASAALVCRAFSEHASRTLWAAPVDDLFTLLSLLSVFKPSTPEQPVESDSSIQATTYYQLDGDYVDPVEWKTLVRCAARIRTLWFVGTGEHYKGRRAIAPSVFAVLSRQSEGRALFPNLRTLGWCSTPSEQEHMRLLRTLLSSAPDLAIC
ncbi:hypothetical protein C8Q80DRAFT_245518 [Daedaleopsis nitida]|nr:hypothetical protein C8Q80DRAFT_245518 [Daedaleopsis nitida]